MAFPTNRALTLTVQVLVILTIVVAVFTKNFALVGVALVCGVAAILFDYLKQLPKPPDLDNVTNVTNVADSGDYDSSLQTAKMMATNPLQPRPKFRQTRQTQQKFITVSPPHNQVSGVQPAGLVQKTRRSRRSRPSLANAVPQNETMESRVGRSMLLRQEADLPIPRGALAEMNRTMLQIAPLPPGPNMQLVTPEELARESMQSAPLLQRVRF